MYQTILQITSKELISCVEFNRSYVPLPTTLHTDTKCIISEKNGRRFNGIWSFSRRQKKGGCLFKVWIKYHTRCSLVQRWWSTMPKKKETKTLLMRSNLKAPLFQLTHGRDFLKNLTLQHTELHHDLVTHWLRRMSFLISINKILRNFKASMFKKLKTVKARSYMVTARSAVKIS